VADGLIYGVLSESNRTMFVLRSMVRLRALAVCAALAVAPTLSAEPPAFPVWPDEAGSVYSQRTTAVVAAEERPTPQPQAVAPAAEPTARIAEVAIPPKDDPRRLAPPRERRSPSAARRDQIAAAADSFPSFGLPLDSMYTTGAALAVVLGLFLLCAGLVRRGAKRANSLLPEEVVSVLGRVPLAARQFAELVRVGNKLVLVSVTPAGAEPLTEITDPAEIDRLVGLCRQRSKGSSTEEFDQVFRRLAEETAPAGFLGNEVPRIDARLAAPADVFAAYRGGTRSA
jgi:flagellar biogenesis protein FliO